MAQLSVRRVATISSPGMHNDGEGLYLHVSKSGAKSWILRTMVRGKRRDIGLGGTTYVSLAEARIRARELRRIARTGGNPFSERDKAQAPTFQEAARIVHAEQIVPTSRNEKHRDQWINTLRDYAFGKIGAKTVDVIDTADILRVLQPIWLTRSETARRVRQRLRTVFAWARMAGHRKDGNPVDDIETALPKQQDRPAHHSAMPWKELPAFYARLETGNSRAAAALAFTILTAGRTGEVLGARWSEIDGDVWEIPALRMKAGRLHRVPLTEDAMAVLDKVRGLDTEFVFPGQRPNKPLSNMSMAMTMRRMGAGEYTPHGMRSAFRDWASERGAQREVAELCLAHTVGNAVERAYARSDMLDQRRNLLAAWGRYCAGGTAEIVRIGA